LQPTIHKDSRADSFRSLAGDFEKLKAAIDGADPSADAKASYATLSKKSSPPRSSNGRR